MRNIELKAKISDLDQTRRTAESIATERLGTEHQVDTYFYCRQGRLKLRQIDRSPAQLIWYARTDRPEARASNYFVVPISNPETLKAALTAALGTRSVVKKRREIFLWHNVRIHLDRVEGLGAFIEFEAVLDPEQDDTVGHARLDELAERFQIGRDNLVSSSYSDLLG